MELLLKHPSSGLYWTEWEVNRYAALGDDSMSRQEAVEELVHRGFKIVWLAAGRVAETSPHRKSSILDSKSSKFPILSTEEPARPGRTGTRQTKTCLGSVMSATATKDEQQLRITALEARMAVLEAMLAKHGHTVPASTTIDPNRYYTANEAGELIGCRKTNVYDLWKTGELAVVNTGCGKKGKKAKGAAIIAFMESREEGGPKPPSSFKYLKM